MPVIDLKKTLYLFLNILILRYRIDDTCDVFSIHGIGGVVRLFLVVI